MWIGVSWVSHFLTESRPRRMRHSVLPSSPIRCGCATPPHPPSVAAEEIARDGIVLKEAGCTAFETKDRQAWSIPPANHGIKAKLQLRAGQTGFRTTLQKAPACGHLHCHPYRTNVVQFPAELALHCHRTRRLG